jgi:hypothetical protein
MIDSSEPSAPRNDDPKDDPYHIAVGIGLGAAIAVCTFVVFATFIVGLKFTHWQLMLKDHFAALVGLPVAAIASFVLVIFLRQTVGPMKVKLPGFEFDGAAGQGIMWIFFFLSMSYSIHLVWTAG